MIPFEFTFTIGVLAVAIFALAAAILTKNSGKVAREK